MKEQGEQRPGVSELRARASAGPPYDDAFLAALETDPRPGAQSIYKSVLRQMDRAARETARIEEMMSFEREAVDGGFRCIAGVDEAGRGPLAGPLAAAAVVLKHPVPGLNDSKQLTAEQREALFVELSQGGHAIGVVLIPPETIDLLGIQTANYSAMVQAAGQLDPSPDFLLVDGFTIPGCRWPHKRIIKGDARSQSIAAASIVAKVTRDRVMHELDHQYPGYGFGEHKGYGTAAHLEALRRLGPCPAHRRSFSPVAECAQGGVLLELDLGGA